MSRRIVAKEGTDVGNADHSRCTHRIRDDGDCQLCISNGCVGGGDCDCDSEHSSPTIAVGLYG